MLATIFMYIGVLATIVLAVRMAVAWFEYHEFKRIKKAERYEPINAKDYLTNEVEAPRDQQWKR